MSASRSQLAIVRQLARRFAVAGLALAFGIAALAAPRAGAASAVSGKSADEIQRALAKEKASSAQLASRESSLLGRLAELERQVEVENRALKAAQTRLRLSQTRLAGAEQKVTQAQAEVDKASAALGPRLTARYQLGREGYVRFLLGARSIGELLRRKRLYSALLEADLDALNTLRFKVMGAAAAREDFVAARDELAASLAAEQEKRSELELKTSVQKKALTQVQQEKGVHEQAARELEQASRALSERLRAIDDARRSGKALPVSAPPGPPQTPEDIDPDARDTSHLVAPSAPLPGAPSAIAPNAAASRAAPPPVKPDATASSSSAPGAAAANSEPPGKKLAMIGPPMRSQRGKLLFPVDSGRIELHFGRTVDPRFGTVTLQRGLDIRAPDGTEVHAVYAGTVVHAGWFSGYGNLVILDHGDGLFSLFAHLGSLAHAVGDVVAKGDALGTVGDTGSLKGPYLYFELRDGQKPLDPERWLSRSHRAAAHK